MSLSTSSTLVDLLLARAAGSGEMPAYTFLAEGEDVEASLSYADLLRRALGIAAMLQRVDASGEPVLLLFPPGLDYVAAFLGCLCAGAVAVPAYPPDPSRLERTLPRFTALVADAQARFALTTSLIRGALDLPGLTWLAVEDATSHEAWRNPGAHPDDLAFLQYTSGSTGDPRGVMLSHANLLHNSEAIQRCFQAGPESRGVIWLPPYHDMGLIGGILQPLFSGFPVVLMSPLAFLARPFRWLSAISRHRGTISGGPNFAYDLCVRKVTPEQRASLDLRSWTLAFNGAEPIHPATLDRFAEAFGPSGFRRSAFYPCYGLAEGTLIAAGGRKGRDVVARDVGKSHLVGCGQSIAGQELRVVDPERCISAAEGDIGEIWVRGPSVARGYWRREEETAATFGGKLANDAEPYLRTGDLGFIADGELFVTGRMKDLVILRGKNFYPQDIERTAVACHRALRPGCAAAFSVPTDREEGLVLALEVDPAKPFEPGALLDDIRRAIVEEHEVQPHAILLLSPGTVPKTSSGKVQRRACRAQYLEREMAVLAESVLSGTRSEIVDPQAEVPFLSRNALLALPDAQRAAALLAPLRSRLGSILGVRPDSIASERPLTTLGFDSIKAIELGARLAEQLDVEVPMALLLGGTSAASLAAHLASALEKDVVSPIRRVPVDPEDAPLSSEQERLLFVESLAPNGTYHIAVAVLIEGPLDRLALSRSLRAVVDRHDVLRAYYPRRGGRRVQVIVPSSAFGEVLVDEAPELPDAPDSAREAAALEWATREAQRPFDLTREPVLRARCIGLGAERHLLTIVVHHIAFDGWSMGILVRELNACYAAFSSGRTPELVPLTLQYAHFADQQRRWLDSGSLSPHLAYWKERLAGAPARLGLPQDRPRPKVAAFKGARHPFALGAAHLAGLEALASSSGTTLYMVLFAGFFALLRQRTRSEDLVVGTVVAGRSHPEAQRLIGLFVNQLVLRVDAAGDPSFRALLERVRARLLEAYAHQQVPFDKLVEALRPPRDTGHSPLFQLLFVLENAPLPELTMGPMRIRAIELDDGGAPFDLSVLLAERAGELGGALRYDTALFDKATIAALGDDYATLLRAIAAQPDLPLSELAALVDAQEQRRLREAALAARAFRLERLRALQKGRREMNTSAIAPRAFPLSPQQARLWAQRGPDARARVVVHIEGALDSVRLQTSITGTGAGVQSASPDLHGLEYLLTELAPGRHELVLDLPALSCDRRGLANMVCAAVARYRLAMTPESAPEPTQDTAPRYIDIASVFNDLLAAPEAKGGRHHFLGYDLATQVGTMKPGARFSHREVPVVLPSAVSIRAVASPAAVLLAGWHSLIRRVANDAQTLLGVAFDGRTYEGFDMAVGLYERFLPFQGPIEERCGLERMAIAIQDRIGLDSEWQDFFDLERELAVIGACTDATPYFPILFSALAWPHPMDAEGVRFQITALESTTARFDLQLLCIERGSNVEAVLQYDPLRCAPQKAELLAQCLATLLAAAIADPAVPMDGIPLEGVQEATLGAREDHTARHCSSGAHDGGRSGVDPEASEGPPSEAERMVAGIWREVLRLPEVGVHQNFFDLGGHSLLMAVVYEKLSAALRRPIPMVELFRHPTVSSLAKHISGTESPRSSTEEQSTAAERQRAGREVQARRNRAARRSR